MSLPVLDEATALVAAALAKHYWPACSSAESKLEPVRSLFRLFDGQRAHAMVGKEAVLAAGIEFNRMVLDAQGRRHNTSVEEANECFRAGRALVAALASLDAEQAKAAEQTVLDSLGRAAAAAARDGTP